MVTYLFRCPDCSLFEVNQPMTSLRPTHSCPDCGSASRRVFTAPALRGSTPGFRRAMDSAESSAEAPQVVRAIPDGPTPPRRGRRWSPATGAPPVNAARRPSGPHQPLPRW